MTFQELSYTDTLYYVVSENGKHYVVHSEGSKAVYDNEFDDYIEAQEYADDLNWQLGKV
jgi:hypothetical protein